MTTKQKETVIPYSEYDLIPEFEPDPPWVRVPETNNMFLLKYLGPMIDAKSCPYCHSNITYKDLGKRPWSDEMKNIIEELDADRSGCEAALYKCSSCGWWCVLQETMLTWSKYDGYLSSVSVNWAKIKKFEIDDVEVPINELRSCLDRKAEGLKLTSIDSLKDTVASCMKNFFPCEVIHIGGPGKEGIDTLLIRSDNPFLIQVMRNGTDSEHRIKVIHELLGILRDENRYQGIVASTKKRFSEAYLLGLAKVPVLEDKGSNVPIYAYDALFDVLNLNQEIHEPWKRLWTPSKG